MGKNQPGMLTCARCGDAFAEAKLVRGAVYRDRSRPLAPQDMFCSYQCQGAATGDIVNRSVRCAVCPRSVVRENLVGRPRVYCSEECRRARERSLDRAWKYLGKGRSAMPGGVDELQAYDQDLAVLAHKLRSEGTDDPEVASALNELRRIANEKAATAKVVVENRWREQHENKRLAADEAGRKARMRAGSVRLDEAIARIRGQS